MNRDRWRTARPMARLREGRTDWFSIKNHAGAGPAIVSIYDEVGYWGVSAQDFIGALAAIDGDIELHLSTPGGEVFDGLAIYGALKQRDGNVAVIVDSLAASIGSVIAMAASPGQLSMLPNATMMIHDGFAMCVGNAADMLETAALLDKTSDNIASVYAERTGTPAAPWREAMRAETWYVGQEAVDAGLADRVLTKATPAQAPVESPDEEPDSSKKMAATFDLSIFRNAPAALRNQAEAEPVTEPAVPEPAPEVPPPPQPDPTEAPADTDRGFVVSEPEPEAVPASEVQGGQGPEPVDMPAGPIVNVEWTSSSGSGDEFLAWLRQNIRSNAKPADEPLGMDTMPLSNKALPVHHTDTVDEPWDGPAAVAAMPNDDAVLRYCHAWETAEADSEEHVPGDDDADDKKSSYKMPHHKTKDGPANLAACRNGLARLGNSKIPDADKAGVKAHLQAHLDDAESGDDTHNHTHDEPTFAWDPDAFLEAFGRGSK